MKKIIIRIIPVIAFLMFAPLLSNAQSTDNGVTSVSTDELRKGVVIQVNQDPSGLNVVVVMEEETGILYISECTALDIREGDTVTYNCAPKGKSTTKIIIRDIKK